MPGEVKHEIYVAFESDNDSERSQIVSLESEDLLPNLLSGEWRLVFAADLPPTALISKLKETLVRCFESGPRMVDAATFEKIDEGLFSNGQRKNDAAGREISWASDAEELLEIVLSRAIGLSDGRSRLYRQLDSIYSKAIYSVGDQRRVATELTEAQCREENLVAEHWQSIRLSGPQFSYYRLPDNWFQFHNVLTELRCLFTRLVEGGLRDGQIICVETASRGDLLVSPRKATIPNLGQCQKPTITHYCLATDLPSSWFSSHQKLPAQKRKAKKWAEHTWNVFLRAERRVSVADIKTVMGEKFSLSTNAVNEVWTRVDVPEKGRLGNIPSAERVDIGEVRLQELTSE